MAKAATGHWKYEGILLICQIRFPMSKILASMKMNSCITNSSRSTNACLCFSVRRRGFLFQQLKTQFAQMLIINLQFFPSRNQIYKENCTRNSPRTIRNSTIPIQKEDWKSKNKKEKQEKSPATAIPLYCLRQLFVSKLYVLCSFNCLQDNAKKGVRMDYKTKSQKKKKT